MPDLTDAQVKALQATAATDRGAYICPDCGPASPELEEDGSMDHPPTCDHCGTFIIDPGKLEDWGYRRDGPGIDPVLVHRLCEALDVRHVIDQWPAIGPLIAQLRLAEPGAHEADELRRANVDANVAREAAVRQRKDASSDLEKHRHALRKALDWPKGEQASWYNLLEAAATLRSDRDRLAKKRDALRDQIATGSRANIYTVLMEAARSIDAAFDELDPDGEIGRRLRAG